MRRLGLIEIFKTEETFRKEYFEEKYYRVLKPDAEWSNPKMALYEPEKFKKTVRRKEELWPRMKEIARKAREARARKR